jgi:phenylacetate-CoA ligase
MIEAYDLTRETFVHFVDNYRRWSPTLIVGYASALRALSKFLLVEGLKLLPPKVVISSAELLDENTRLLIERAFCCPVMDRYGCREMGLIACQCLEGRQYHVNMQRIYLEVITDHSKGAPEDESGKLVVTDLGNYGMPLIRYEIGDRGRLSLRRQCECGRQSECLSLIEGRTVDFLIASDGRKVHGLYFNRHIFKVSGVSQYRLVQESRDLIRLQVIENGPVTIEQIEGLIRLIREKIGENITVQFEKVASLPKTSSGKLRYIECHVHPDEPNALFEA